MAEYIEREAFIESQQHLYCENCARRKDGKGKFVYDIGDAPCRACGIMDVLDAVADFPAYDVRPVVRGEWIKYAPDNSDMMTCSECEKYWILDGDQYDYHFCPNCGADMRPEPPKEAE